MPKGDGFSHLAQIFCCFDSFKQGNFFPIWSNYYDCGSPVVIIYSPLYSWFAGFIAFLLNNLYLGIKISLLSWHLLSGVGTYLWVKSLTGNRQAGFIAGLSMVLCFWHGMYVVYPSRWHSALSVALAPFILYFIELFLAKKNKTGSFILTAITTGALLISSYSSGFWLFVFCFLYANLRIIFINSNWIDRIRSFFILNFAFIIGVCLTAPYTVPAFLGYDHWIDIKDSHWSGEAVSERLTYLTSAVSIIRLINWSNFHMALLNIPRDPWTTGYFGISIFLMAFLGIRRYFIKSQENRNLLPVLVLFVFSGIIVFGFSLPIVHNLPMILVSSSDRYLFIFLLFICALAAFGYLFVADKKPLIKERIFTFIVILILADLGSTTFQKPWMREYGWSTKPLFQRIIKEFYPDNRSLPNFRLVALGTDVKNFGIYPSWRSEGLVPIISKIPTATGCVEDVNIRSHEFSRNLVIENIISSFQQGQFEISPSLIQGLWLLNIKFIVTDHYLNGPGLKEFTTLNQYRLYQTEEQSPVVVTRNIKKLETSSLIFPFSNVLIRSAGPISFTNRQKFLNDYISRMHIDMPSKTCATLFTLDRTATISPSDDPRIDIDLLENYVLHDRIEMKIWVDSEAYARLSYSYYPGLTARINDKKVPVFPTADKFCCLKLEKGSNTITLRTGLTLLEKKMMLLAVGICLLILFIFWGRRRIDLLFDPRKESVDSAGNETQNSIQENPDAKS
jgi:hypothetical protein